MSPGSLLETSPEAPQSGIVLLGDGCLSGELAGDGQVHPPHMVWSMLYKPCTGLEVRAPGACVQLVPHNI